MNRIEINVQTGETTVVSLTAQEIAQAETQNRLWLAEQATAAAEEQATTNAKQSALNKLKALELTQDEVKALVG